MLEEWRRPKAASEPAQRIRRTPCLIGLLAISGLPRLRTSKWEAGSKGQSPEEWEGVPLNRKEASCLSSASHSGLSRM